MAKTGSAPPAPTSADIGVIGLAVMGRNLARNLARNDFAVALYNRTAARTDEFIAAHGAEGTFLPAHSLTDFVASLRRPRTMILMVQAGQPTDAVINQLAGILAAGDIIVDGGNAHFEDTRRREAALREGGLHFVGAGISGGESGALHGPSIMPGGSAQAYQTLGPILERIAAQADGEPCCTHIGPDGAGHFVKMVHNGIEYADMQLIAEAYDILRHRGLTPQGIAEVFAEWNRGELDSYLIGITAEVLRHVDPHTRGPFVDVVADHAAQKGTGRWTVQSALELGVPLNTIAESVFARSASGHLELRAQTRTALTAHPPVRPTTATAPTAADIEELRQALWAAKVVAYAQGMDHIRIASEVYSWGIDLAEVAKIWRAGCIIRARLLHRIRDAYAGAAPTTLLAAPGIAADLAAAIPAWRRTVSKAVREGIPVPGLSGALAHVDTLRADRLPAALIQGLRDYFGAHSYQRVDRPGWFHTDWSGSGKEQRVADE